MFRLLDAILLIILVLWVINHPHQAEDLFFKLWAFADHVFGELVHAASK